MCHAPIGTVKSDKVTGPLGGTGFSAAGDAFRYAELAGADRCCEILLSRNIKGAHFAVGFDRSAIMWALT